MIKKIILLIVILFSAKITAQEEAFQIPDYKAIEKEIQDKNSPNYYPKLMERLVKNDTLLTAENYKHLYLGYVFQPEYNAFWTSKNEKKLRELYGKEKLETADYDKIIELINSTLKEFPFDLNPINYLAYVYHLKGDEGMAKSLSFKFHSIMNTILSSGDGKTCETGFHVLLVDHEYTLLSFFELEPKGQSLIGKCDYLKFEKGKYKVDGIYFNIEKMLENETKAFKK